MGVYLSFKVVCGLDNVVPNDPRFTPIFNANDDAWYDSLVLPGVEKPADVYDLPDGDIAALFVGKYYQDVLYNLLPGKNEFVVPNVTGHEIVTCHGDMAYAFARVFPGQFDDRGYRVFPTRDLRYDERSYVDSYWQHEAAGSLGQLDAYDRVLAERLIKAEKCGHLHEYRAGWYSSSEHEAALWLLNHIGWNVTLCDMRMMLVWDWS